MRTLVIIALTFFFSVPTALAVVTCPDGCSPGTLNPNSCVDAAGEACTISNGGNTAETITNGGNTGRGSGVTLINPLQGGGNLDSFLSGILAFVIRIGTVVVILMMVFVGFKFVTAQGEPGKITEARTMLLWTIVGALILLGAKAIQLGITATVQALSTGS